jgi:hypothetical protein
MKKLNYVSFLLVLLAVSATASAQKVFSVQYENQAGWRKREKIPMMY